MHRNLCAAYKRNGASNFGATLAESDSQEGDEAATIELTLINHGRRQPSGTNARNADSVHNPGDYIVQLAFDGCEVPAEHRPRVKQLMSRIVEVLQETIGIIDFWKKPIEVKRLRGNIDTEILLTEIPQLTDRHERLAVEIVKLAEKRHTELTR